MSRTSFASADPGSRLDDLRGTSTLAGRLRTAPSDASRLAPEARARLRKSRDEVVASQDGLCSGCWEKPTHIVPLRDGNRSSDPAYFTALCASCRTEWGQR